MAFPDPLHDESDDWTTWTSVNFAEGLPGVPSPLSWSWTREPTELGLRHTFVGLGALSKSERRLPRSSDRRFIGTFYGRPVANLDMFRAMGDAIPGASGAQVERGLFGGLRPGVSDRPERLRYPIVAARLPLAAMGERRRLVGLNPDITLWWASQLLALSSGDAVSARAAMTEARRRYAEIAGAHGSCSIIAQAIYEQLRELCAQAGSPGLETLLVSFDVAETQLAQDVAALANETITQAELLAAHGYHGPRAAEITSTVWREDPQLLRPMLAAARENQGRGRERAVQRAAERSQARTSLLASCAGPTRARARLLLASARQFIPLRELGRSTFLRTCDVARAASRILGSHLSTQGVIDQPADIAFLTYDEAVGPPQPDFRQLIDSRREQFNTYQTCTVPTLWTGQAHAVPLGESTKSYSGSQGPASTGQITGIPASHGVVEGRVRVVLDPATTQLGSGEVLVCRTTDPSWAPMFDTAVGAIIDIGSAMSHGAIVAREFGLPCVINTKDGTRRLHDGQLVRVDGNAGTVTILGCSRVVRPSARPSEF